MRAVVIERPGVAKLSRVSVPEPGPEEIMVAVAAAGICGSDVEVLRGRRPEPYVRYPIVPGHEWAGTVAATGAAVAGINAGDRVVAEGFRSCGVCERCREGRSNLCMSEYSETGFTHQGAFAEYVCVPARLVHRLPDDTDLEAAALLEPAACVAEGLLSVDLWPGLRVAVVGAGTLGLLAISMLQRTSPARLALVGTRPARLELGRRLGAHETHDVNAGPLDSLYEGFDLVVEAANRPEAAATALMLARRGGTVILEGISGVAQPAIRADAITLKHLNVRGVFGASGAAWNRAVMLYSEGLLPLAELVSHRFDLEDFQSAFDVLENRGSGAVKVQLLPR
jgi:2-desacetyl-2-hydroxyethyl bacteriochlorophyllide A dehydrogenase